MNKKILSLMVMAALSVAACTPEERASMGTKQTIGGVSGAILGGVVGSKIGKGSGQLVGVGIGTLLGTLVGSEIGKSLDAADRAYADRATQRAYTAPVGETVSWNNPDSGNSGTITPVRDGTSTSGRYCREYTQTIYVGGQKETGTGTACRNPDGTWQIQN